MMKREANNIISDAQIQFSRRAVSADQLLRQNDIDSATRILRIPRSLHERVLEKGRKLEAQLALASRFLC
jgi:hypothetical protein